MYRFVKSVWALYFSTFVVGGILLYELYTGEAIARGTRRITRRDTPFRYWFWILLHAVALAILIFAWVSGVGTN